jgi:NAD-dependent deacetylase
MDALSPEVDAAIDRAVELLLPAKSLLFITGAGLSADSGLPTYRGIGGLYNDSSAEDGLPIEAILSGQMLRLDPERTWRHLARVAKAGRGATFNRGHSVIAGMEQSFHRVCVLTQNVDGFHREAGSTNVIDIHGDLHDLICTDRRCAWRGNVPGSFELDEVPRCPDCNAVLRPEVVLFGEELPRDKLKTLYAELDRGFDVTFSIGTTSVFPYIAEPILLAADEGRPTVEINPGDTEVTKHVTVKIALGAARALDEIARRYSSRA